MTTRMTKYSVRFFRRSFHHASVEELIPPGRSVLLRAMGFFEWGKESRTSSEEALLAGARARVLEWFSALQVLWEMLDGFRRLHTFSPCVTIFGSARLAEKHEFYETARKLAADLALSGFAIMTGGGPGIMEAANRGAQEAGGRSVGCNITLPREQKPNPYLDRWVEFRFFMVRKFMLAKYSYAFVAFPGGFGTLDELFGVLTLIQTKKISNFPVVLIGTEYWKDLRHLITNTLVANQTINPEDVELVLFTDSTEEAADFIRKTALDRFGLKLKKIERRKHANTSS